MPPLPPPPQSQPTTQPETPETEPTPEPAEMSEGDRVAHLIDLAGYLAQKHALTQDDRIKRVMDAAMKEVQAMNVLPDLLRLMHAQNAAAAAKQAQPTMNEKREDERRQFEQDYRQKLLDRNHTVGQQRQIELQAVQMMLDQLKKEATTSE